MVDEITNLAFHRVLRENKSLMTKIYFFCHTLFKDNLCPSQAWEKLSLYALIMTLMIKFLSLKI